MKDIYFPDDTPNFEVSDFSGAHADFVFDLVKLEGRNELPRPFLHRHSYYHILWMSNARGNHVLDFDNYGILPHSVFFISPGQIHGWNSEFDASGYAINFSPEFFLQIFPRIEELADFPFFHIANTDPVLYLTPTEHDELYPLLKEIEKENAGDQRWRYDVVRSFLQILLTKLRRLHKPHGAGAVLPRSYSLTKRFKFLIEQHYLEYGSVQDYAARLFVTDRKLNDAVKITTGRTATQLIHDRILMEAKRLLAQSELSIAEISYRLNFDDFAYFCRFFKKNVQMTPGEFKKKFSAPLS
ncbi:DNA-binding domain-containing protein, AraC-type [Herbaspirillum sp. CF444]|uniref:helix-turn-helix domain-containing protein n=1 Tax=Herbaspirillum sp. CF444 TaxID=1144319 RepID=UPI0002724088|nr:helix-turn-helix domain-containing protein [Herbaspirillum sp. CF444]EJL83501.1 DNA-binding domain-containing protein, AraC-type [Herbaspirillum sp. CF444]